MANVLEINRIEQLSEYRHAWWELLCDTPGGSFFQSLEWLEVYWRHFGEGQKLRVLVVVEAGEPVGIVPLVVRCDKTRVGKFSVLTFPLDHWWSSFGPIGPDVERTLAPALEHIRRTPRDWDFLEFRWLGSPGADAMQIRSAMSDAGFSAYPTVTDQAALVDLDGGWDSYWSGRKGAWLRRFRHAERELARQGEISHVRYRPRGMRFEDGSPRWDLYDVCEKLAGRSWQGSATDGTTLSHESVRGFLREAHAAAAEAGAVDLNLLLIDGAPTAFIYGYYFAGRLIGLRRGYDAAKCAKGAGTVLLAYTLRDSFARGDSLYDMGVGSLESKRYFQTRLAPIIRLSYFPRSIGRSQLLRFARWRQSLGFPASIAVDREQNLAADPR
jgi:CelD/BcsL family acetyltransferase involved in cellulose biosynthesis